MRALGAVLGVVVLAASGCHSTFRQLPVRGGPAETSRVEPLLSRGASALAGGEVEVRCWSARDWNELVEDIDADDEPQYVGKASEDEIDLSPVACEPLVAFLYGGRRLPQGGARLELASGLAVLAHELEHARGIVDEATAECYAVQRLGDLAAEIGIRAPDARILARLYWTDLYEENADEYISDECRDGGELDLRAADPRWP